MCLNLKAKVTSDKDLKPRLPFRDCSNIYIYIVHGIARVRSMLLGSGRL